MSKISELVKTDELGRVIGEVKLQIAGWRESYFMPFFKDYSDRFVGIDETGNMQTYLDGWYLTWHLRHDREETIELTRLDLKLVLSNNVDVDQIWQELIRIAKDKK